jgi:hypothetical protein
MGCYYDPMSSPDPQELPYDDQIADLNSKLSFARQKVEELEAELDWWQRGRDLYGKATTSAPNGSANRGAKPTLATAIIAVMEAVLPERAEWTAPEVMEQLRERGWMPNGKNAEHTVRTKLGQLAQADGPLTRVRHGVYILNIPDEPGDEPRLGEQIASGLAGVATGVAVGKLASSLMTGAH